MDEPETTEQSGKGPVTNFLLDLGKKEEKEEIEDFEEAKAKLNEDIFLISNKLETIKTFNKYKDLNYELENNNIEIDEKKHSECFLVFAIIVCGLFFPLFQLIGVQEQLIVLNSLLNELIEEFRLATKDIPRQYNFYEVIKICSFKEVPDMEISMFTSFIGIAAIKHLGYFWTNFCFQLLPGLMFFFFFYYFSFHTGKELDENYISSEIIILAVTTILGFILVGGSSIISLKQISILFKSVFRDFKFDITKSYNYGGKDDFAFSEKGQKIYDFMSVFFYIFFSGLSLLFTILINKYLIYILDNNIIRKKFLYGIRLIYTITCILTLILFEIHSCSFKKSEEKNELEGNDQIQNTTSEELSILSNGPNKNPLNKSTQTGDEETGIKSIKTFTCCGYLFFQKETKNKRIYILSKYEGKCSWIIKNMFGIINIIIAVYMLLCQLLCISFKQILSDRMLNNFSDWKNILFLGILILFAFILGGFIAIIFSGIEKSYEKSKYFGVAIIFIWLYFFLTFLSIITLIFSSIHYAKNNHGTGWDYIYMIQITFFKFVECQMFNSFGVFNGESALDSSLILNFENLIWTIFENISDVFEFSTRHLVLVQIIVSPITTFLCSVVVCLYYAIIFNKSKQ